jgi:lipoprotein-releasing system ATP-binding protein
MRCAMSNVLECRGVEKTYIDGTRKLHILRGVDLAVPEGMVTAITGASGAGKSTLLHLMGTLDRPSAGDILLRGESIARLGRDKVDTIRNREIGFVFQFYHLLPEFTALENTMMPGLAQGRSRRACRGRAEELLARVGLSERMTHKPGQLSGGEQQRVAIARALYNAPSIVLADEPTGNLDEITGKGIIDLIWDLQRTEGLTLVLVTHDLDIAALAHQHVRLHEGKAEAA